jgi:hypothetical protein
VRQDDRPWAPRAEVAPKTAPEELRGRVAATQWTPEYRPASAHGAA